MGEEAEIAMKKRKGFIVGFNLNLDAIVHVNNELLDELKGSEIYEDLCRSINEGVGHEISASEATIFLLSRVFEAYNARFRLGGNGGIIANTIATLGESPVILNAPHLSARVVEQLNSDGIRIPLRSSHGIELLDPVSALSMRGGSDELIHFVFEFETEKGGKERFIVNGGLEREVEIDPAFAEISAREAKRMKGAVISGFHLLPDEMCEDKISEVARLLEAWKRENPDLFTHCELGAFRNFRLAHRLLEEFRGMLESVGMNGEELLGLSGVHSPDVNPDTIFEKAQELLGLYEPGLVVVHTERFMAGVMRDGGYDPGAFADSLDFGARVAAAYIMKGKFPDIREISAVLGGCKPTSERVIEKRDGFVCITTGVYPLPSLVQAVGRGDVFTGGYVLRASEILGGD